MERTTEKIIEIVIEKAFDGWMGDELSETLNDYDFDELVDALEVMRGEYNRYLNVIDEEYKNVPISGMFNKYTHVPFNVLEDALSLLQDYVDGENEKRFQNSIWYAITRDENDENKAYLSFTSPLGEVHNIGFTIKSDIVADAMECLADHLKVLVSLGGTDMEKTSEKMTFNDVTCLETANAYNIAMSESFTDDKKRELLKQFSVEELEECASEIEELADETKARLIAEYGEEEYDENEEYYGQVNDLEYLAELVYDVIDEVSAKEEK